MTPAIPLEKLTRAELLFLVKRFYRIDQKHVANCRWEVAEDEAKRLRKIAHDLEDIEIPALIASTNKPENRKLRTAWLKAAQISQGAKDRADRARRLADARFKALRQYGLDQA